MAKDTFYFSHDYNARSDEKVKLLIRKHGMVGYGVFWSIVEDLYNNANALRTDYEGIAFDLHSTEYVVKSVICDFDLFIIEGESFGSLSVERRLNERNEKSVKAKESANYRWNKIKDNANAMQTHSDGNAIKERKVKERKVKEIKEVHEPTTKFEKFNQWIQTERKNVSKMSVQMTEKNFETLIRLYGDDRLIDIINQMENKKDLTKKYTSVYLTANTWLKR